MQGSYHWLKGADQFQWCLVYITQRICGSNDKLYGTQLVTGRKVHQIKVTRKSGNPPPQLLNRLFAGAILVS